MNETTQKPITRGEWFRLDLYSDQMNVAASEPTGSMMRRLGSSAAPSPSWYAFDEDGGRHEINPFSLNQPGIGCLHRLDIPAATAEDLLALYWKGQQKQRKADQDRAEREEKRRQELAALPALHPLLITHAMRPEVSHYALGALNIRNELRKAWPGVKFSVRSRGYSGGCSIDIEWVNGPTSRQVEAITDKYSQGDFDGMTDSYNYSSSQFPDVFGGARYVFAKREYTIDGIRQAWAAAGFNPGEVVEVEQWSQLGEHQRRSWAKYDLTGAPVLVE